ncbi:hypothetical protein [Glycomyces arizonensis]|uniref:hypothetical protein n=1 Tax=Glycomyces arizonensis TaxID=256035 RepID=UPI0004096103|nr:hypothetical protein [Glycomyces arizonensis]
MTNKPRKWKWVRRVLTLATAMAVALSAGLVALGAAPAAAGGPTLVPLISFYSAARGDYFTTTQSVWTCQYYHTCSQDPDYDVVGMQGFVYNPANPQPARTVPLYHWWNPTRGDNWLTTDPRWAGEVGDRQYSGGWYELFRIEGYVSTQYSSVFGELHSYWNPTVGDNAAIGTWERDQSEPSGWTRYRFEGYLFPPSSRPNLECLTDDTPSYQDDPKWNALGNYVNDWDAPASFLDGDALKVDADPNSTIRIDYWGTQKPVFGHSGDTAPGMPAPGLPPYSLIGRVTSGAMYVEGWGWAEAYEWFPVVGTVDTGSPSPSPCLLYESRGGTGQKFQLSFNDSNLGDNGGYAPVTVTQWW